MRKPGGSGDDGLNSPVRLAWKRVMDLAESRRDTAMGRRITKIRESGKPWPEQIAAYEALYDEMTGDAEEDLLPMGAPLPATNGIRNPTVSPSATSSEDRFHTAGRAATETAPRRGPGPVVLTDEQEQAASMAALLKVRPPWDRHQKRTERPPHPADGL